MRSSAPATNTAPRRHRAASSSSGPEAAGEWAAVSGAGAWTVEEVGKHQLRRRTGLPARDLRALDPARSPPSSSCYTSGVVIVARDRAVVVILDRARAVITAAEVLVPGPRDPAVAPLVRELRARLVTVASTQQAEAAVSPAPAPALPPQEDGVDKDAQAASGSDKALPFEFRALEVCLEFACKSLEHETRTLEKEAYPALDELTSKVSKINLERVRQLKSRLVAISGRVQKVRDELEHLLDDDVGMAAMHLTEKLAYQEAAGYSSRSDNDNEPSELYEDRGDGSSNGAGNGGFTPKIQELEILLEAYFVEIEGTLNKLSTLREYVDDTEDYINIMLDEKQNQLLQMGIMLSTATLVVSCAIAAAGVFGMNIRIPLYDDATTGVFWQTTGGIVGAGAAIYLLTMLCYRRTGILQ